VTGKVHPPALCPTCGERMQITALGCRCGTGVTGRFEPCEFCALNPDERELLQVFLTSRGNTRDLERHLGVSYPTARARFEEVLATLGYFRTPPDRKARKLDVLRAVATGDLDVDDALNRLS
jgi:hypothetical protein